MFVHNNAGLILTMNFPEKKEKKTNFSNFQIGNYSNSAKAAFQMTHIFMHVHFILSKDFYKFAKTLYSYNKYNPLSVCTWP